MFACWGCWGGVCVAFSCIADQSLRSSYQPMTILAQHLTATVVMTSAALIKKKRFAIISFPDFVGYRLTYENMAHRWSYTIMPSPSLSLKLGGLVIPTYDPSAVPLILAITISVVLLPCAVSSTWTWVNQLLTLVHNWDDKGPPPAYTSRL